jgi:hypothetical protein
LDPDDVPLIEALAARDVRAEAVVWDNPEVDWAQYALVAVRSTWDYSTRRDEFVAWAQGVGGQLHNAPAVLRWNTDKGYLRDLADAGVAVISTLWLDPKRDLSARAIHTRLPAYGDFVIKPVVSAGVRDTGRYQAGDANSRGLAIQHVKRLLGTGREVMIQPYVMSVDTAGETGLVFFNGEFSHAVRKNALLRGPYRPTQGLYRRDHMEQITPADDQLELARRALDVAAARFACDAKDFLYARVDVVRDAEDVATLIELELAEPSLFMAYVPGAVERFADAIVARLASSRAA